MATLGYTTMVFATDRVSELENILAIQPFFFILALLVGYITQQRFRETEERQSLQQLITAEANAKSLLDLAKTMNRVMDPTIVSNDLARIGVLITGMPYCVIFTHDPDKDALVYQGSSLSLTPENGDSEPFFQPVEERTFLSTAWEDQEMTYLNVSDEGVTGQTEWLKKIDAHRAMAYPLTCDGEKVGVISLVGTAAGPEFSGPVINAVHAFSKIAARFLANTQLYAQAEKRSRRVATELQQSIEMAGRFRDLSQRKIMRFGPLLIEPNRESARWQDLVLRLTKTEFDLLYVLAEKSGSVLNQDTLIREVWGQDYVPQGKVVDVTVHRLRRKLATFPEGRKLIRTVRGQGYAFMPPERFVSV